MNDILTEKFRLMSELEDTKKHIKTLKRIIERQDKELSETQKPIKDWNGDRWMLRMSPFYEENSRGTFTVKVPNRYASDPKNMFLFSMEEDDSSPVYNLAMSIPQTKDLVEWLLDRIEEQNDTSI